MQADPAIITILMFGLMFLLMALGLPICFVLGGCALFFGVVFWGPASLNVVILNASNLMNSSILVAVPLFVFMAYMLEKSGVAEDLYQAMHLWMGPIRGGLAAGSVIGCTLIAAMSGISTTGVLMMGIIGLPAMLRRGYDKYLAMGSIMAGGALGPLIPPSLVLIVYAMISGESVGKLFLGGVLPGMLLSSLFLLYIFGVCFFKKQLGPALPRADRANRVEKLSALKGLIFPLLLIAGVLGTLFMGIATPTEAAAVGAAGSLLSAVINRKLNWKILSSVNRLTLKTVAMVMWIIFGAGCFAAIYQGLGVAMWIKGMITSLPVSKWAIIIMMQMVWIVLGCLMDSLSIMMITTPVFLPVVSFLHVDLLWFGILFVVNTEMGYLTPPFGVNLFVMRGIAPNEISTLDIYRAATPFIIIQAVCVVIVMLFPGLATWLPGFI